MKKIIIGIVIVVVLAAAIAGIVSYFASRSGSGGTASTSGTTSSTAAALVKIYQMPTSSMITLGTPHGSVTMKNFYLTSAGAEDQFIVLAMNSNYEITYDPAANEFYIYIAAAPYEANRTQAEADFLARLGVSKTDACKLTVGENGKTGLSFCATAGVIQ